MQDLWRETCGMNRIKAPQSMRESCGALAIHRGCRLVSHGHVSNACMAIVARVGYLASPAYTVKSKGGHVGAFDAWAVRAVKTGEKCTCKELNGCATFMGYQFCAVH